ncbi:hypothetical protein TYRP_006039, partial [Tyrophagus putrescentiae]
MTQLLVNRNTVMKKSTNFIFFISYCLLTHFEQVRFVIVASSSRPINTRAPSQLVSHQQQDNSNSSSKLSPMASALQYNSFFDSTQFNSTQVLSSFLLSEQ